MTRKKKLTIETKQFTSTKDVKWLPVKLSSNDTLERARTMSQRHKELKEVEAEKNRVTREFGLKVKNLSGEIQRLSDIVNSGEEYQSVDCEIHKHYVDGVVKTIRLDTGEIIEKRPMTDGEKQQEIPLEEKFTQESEMPF